MHMLVIFHLNMHLEQIFPRLWFNSKQSYDTTYLKMLTFCGKVYKKKENNLLLASGEQKSMLLRSLRGTHVIMNIYKRIAHAIIDRAFVG